MRTGVNLYWPSVPVVMVNSAPVPSLLSVTLAPLTAAPEESVTLPKIEPASTCASDGAAEHNTINKQDATARTSRPPQNRTVLRCITSSSEHPPCSRVRTFELMQTGSKRLLWLPGQRTK